MTKYLSAAKVDPHKTTALDSVTLNRGYVSFKWFKTELNDSTKYITSGTLSFPSLILVSMLSAISKHVKETVSCSRLAQSETGTALCACRWVSVPGNPVCGGTNKNQDGCFWFPHMGALPPAAGFGGGGGGGRLTLLANSMKQLNASQSGSH